MACVLFFSVALQTALCVSRVPKAPVPPPLHSSQSAFIYPCMFCLLRSPTSCLGYPSYTCLSQPVKSRGSQLLSIATVCAMLISGICYGEPKTHTIECWREGSHNWRCLVLFLQLDTQTTSTLKCFNCHSQDLWSRMCTFRGGHLRMESSVYTDVI